MSVLYHDSPDDSLPTPTSKVCSRCDKEKPLEEFYRSKRGLYGRRGECKKCAGSRPIEHIPAPTSKLCSRCGKEKPIECFSKASKQKNGYRSYCKDCASIEQRSRNTINRPVTVTSKVCSRCGIEKSASEFGTDPRSTTGLRSECNECRKPEGHNRYVRKYGLKRKQLPPAVNGGKVCIRCRKERPFSQFSRTIRPKDSRDGYAAQCNPCKQEVQVINHTPEGLREKARLWREENLEYSRARSREWKRDNPLKVRETNARREAVKKAAQVEDDVDYIHILERDNCWCYICNDEIIEGQRIAFDHMIPLIPLKGTNRKPGIHAEWNIKLTHYLCNARKGNKLLEELSAYDRRGIRSGARQFHLF